MDIVERARAGGVPERSTREIVGLERRLHLLLVEVDLGVRRYVSAWHVAGNRRRLGCARLRAGVRGGAVQQTAHLRARDAEARVHVLERRLDRAEVGVARGVGHAAAIREQAELEVGAHHGG